MGRIGIEEIETFFLCRTIYASEPIDSFEILKVSRPQKGKYCLRVSQVEEKKEKWVGLVEVLVVKKNKRFPLPKLPGR